MNQPAGWYPQPNDPTNVRWWDGTQWTEHTQPALPRVPAGEMPVVPITKRRGAKIATAAALLVLLGFILIFVPGLRLLAWLPPLAGLVVAIVALSKKQRLTALSIVSLCLAPFVAFIALAVASADQGPSTPVEPFDAKNYSPIDERSLAQIVKDPDGASGQKLITYARISQFDSATGTCTFRADTAHERQESIWDYTHNSVYTAETGAADCDDLSKLVADDVVQIYATVDGSQRYKTMIGGQNVVPLFAIDSIKLIK